MASFLDVALFYFQLFISFRCFHKQVVDVRSFRLHRAYGSADKLRRYYHETIYVCCMRVCWKNEAILARATIIYLVPFFFLDFFALLVFFLAREIRSCFWSNPLAYPCRRYCFGCCLL